MRDALVFIPGLGCDERLFAAQIDHFSDRYACCVMVPKGAVNIDEMARLIMAELAFDRFNLVGLSLGGIVAMAMIRNNAKRIGRLALLDTNHLADTADRKSTRTRLIQDVRSGHFHAVLQEEVRPEFLGSKLVDKTPLMNTILDMALNIGPALFIEQMIATRDRANLIDTLQTYQGPSLVLCGEDDRVCPPERHDDMANLLKLSERVTVPGSGHYSSMENPEAVNAALEALLKRPIE